MTEEERWKKLEELREEFRKMRPDLNLPPARRGQAPSHELALEKTSSHSEPEQSSEKSEGRSEEVKRKIETVRETAREQPKTIAKMLKKYTDWNKKK